MDTVSIEYFNTVVQALTSQRNAALDQLAVAQAQAIMAEAAKQQPAQQPAQATREAATGTTNPIGVQEAKPA